MISIITAYDEAAKEKALAAGFAEQLVLVRYDPAVKSQAEKRLAEGAIMREIRPFQFIVGGYWGACPD